jgi:tetratricopeptide (TPR) repeat protein
VILRHYTAPCPACGTGTILLADIPSQTYVQNYLPGPRKRIEGNDPWRYAVTSACLRCGASDTLRELPAGAREYHDREEQAELERGLAQIERGSRPDVEAAWHEALAGCHQRAGDAERAVHELAEAIELLWPHRGRADARLTSILATMAPYLPSPAARVLTRTYRAAAALGEVPVVANQLVSLAELYVAEGRRDAARRVLERAWKIYEHAPAPAAEPDAWGGADAVAAASRAPGSLRDQGIVSCAFALVPIYAALGLTAERADCEARVLAIWSPLYGEEMAQMMIAAHYDPP